MRHLNRAVVLLAVAVSATSGCVAVDGQQEPGGVPPSGRHAHEVSPSPGGATPRDGRTPRRGERPRPDRERSPSASAGEPRPATSSPAPEPERAAPPGGTAGPADGAAGGQTPPVRSARPQPPRDVHGVCELGRSYGGWPEGSPQEQLCRGTYDD